MDIEPAYVAAGGGTVWVAKWFQLPNAPGSLGPFHGAFKVFQLDPSTGRRVSTPVRIANDPVQPLYGFGSVWAANSTSRAVLRISTPTVKVSTPSNTAGEIGYKCGDSICLMHSDGTGQRDLLPGAAGSPFPQWDPAWSTDGKQVAFRGYYGPGDGQYDLYTVDATGCNLFRLTHGVNGTSPSW